jgi:hypothetical protein
MADSDLTAIPIALQPGPQLGSIRVGEEFVRRRIVTLAACLLPMASGSEARAAACKPADPSLAGHYYLRGVMEVGSELLLHADGRFEYMLAYGALDELASGCWTRSGATVTLDVRKFENSMDDPMKFKRVELTVQPGGKLMRRFDAEHAGAYSGE